MKHDTPWSLVNRLTLVYTVSSFFLLSMVIVALYWSLARTLDVDDNLFISDKAQTILHLLNADPRLHSVKDRVEKEWVSRAFERCYIKILNSHGATLAETPNFAGVSRELFENAPSFAIGQPGKAAALLENQSGRVFKVEIVRAASNDDPAHEKIIRIALDRTSEETVLKTFRSKFLTLLAAALIVLTLLNRRIAIKGIQPISQIAETASRIRSTTLHERINVLNVPTELRVLVTTFNEMLDRLNESFDRLSRFSQDIAHDLRTPLNNLQGELEVALSRPRSTEDYENTLGSCLEECVRLTSLINNLLFLARAENPASGLTIKALDLKTEVLRIREFFEASASEAGIKLEIMIADQVPIKADLTLLQQAIGNLIANAITYSGKQSAVVISGRIDGSSTVVTVADSGIGIAKEHLHRIFDRFYRVDQARSSNSGGTGLGLAIVKGIMTLHKGSVTIESDQGRGATLTLTFPLA